MVLLKVIPLVLPQQAVAYGWVRPIFLCLILHRVTSLVLPQQAMAHGFVQSHAACPTGASGDSVRASDGTRFCTRSRHLPFIIVLHLIMTLVRFCTRSCRLPFIIVLHLTTTLVRFCTKSRRLPYPAQAAIRLEQAAIWLEQVSILLQQAVAYGWVRPIFLCLILHRVTSLVLPQQAIAHGFVQSHAACPPEP